MSISYAESDNGYYDNMGGFHKDGTGYNPHGVWCGECCSSTCEGCVNADKTEE